MEQRSFRAFDTINVVRAYPCDNEVLDEVEDLCSRFERLFSHTDPQSELSFVNGANGGVVEVSDAFASLIAASLGYCAETGGLFDITMGPVVSLWDFKRGVIPSRDAVAEALTHVDYRKVRIAGRSLRLEDPHASIIFAGIAKGFIADAVLDLLRERGVTNAIVNLGGNVAVMGGKRDGGPFNIGLRAPVSSKRQPESVFAVVPIFDGSIVTSGVYERAFERDGVRYHHILDPRTGLPAETDIVSASVVARSSLDAEGLSTALVVMGLERALDFVEAREGVEAVFSKADGDVVATSGILASL